ncbi:hypothetical protein KVR01_000035 [Diaporthe batatas]|uniref:uncharacterized protein n=1 Tax=Diaporthe batatas TaxID=748121 RepID=UPI001D058924|nr:uncharacterized protein KVR01_000035 [Diaporthe batatas]KAG8169290.1 hypothetical protein KVR01_000035 [Diaporthe batatas]
MSPQGLDTIEERDAETEVTPTVATVEKAAAAKIYLETYFNDRLAHPNAREARLRQLDSRLWHVGVAFPEAERDRQRRQFFRNESDHLRETRAMKARTMRALKEGRGTASSCCNDYQVVKALGKGSFGVVRLVREKRQTGDKQPSGRVYAMKVIRKSGMLRTSQEGHLRAERDFLVASEGSRWVVPLIASFQDASNLYLVMDYMPGGDFLGLLIRENILSEPVARFYIAEMIICVEEAHALHCIHRDIKPDNFLVSASGHLKISDFGLAFDGHWSHDSSYYQASRYSIVQKLNLEVVSDEQDRLDALNLAHNGIWGSNIMMSLDKHENKSSSDSEPLLQWRNRCGMRTLAKSVVGTSQYMAPEVVQGAGYDGRCDWWSIGVILYECLHGNSQAFTDRFVFPYDAEDIKAHKWFKGVPWERLHELDPPFVPLLRSTDDTQYFDDDKPITDLSDSDDDDDQDDAMPTPETREAGQSSVTPKAPATPVVVPAGPVAGTATAVAASSASKKRAEREALLAKTLAPFNSGIQVAVRSWLKVPYDSLRLRNFENQVDDEPGLRATERDTLKALVRFILLLWGHVVREGRAWAN